MSEQQQNGARRSEQVSALLRSAKTMDGLEAAHAEEKRRADHYERVYNKAEAENGQLREMLDRMISERDGYFQDACTLRAQLMGIGHAVTNAVKSIMSRQAITHAGATATAQIDDEAPIPQFLRNGPRSNEEKTPQGLDLGRFANAIRSGAAGVGNG
jgi:hypothetical protein